MVPCTTLGCLMMLRRPTNGPVGDGCGRDGRSNIVGRRWQRSLNDSCTVTLPIQGTRTFARVVRALDIVIEAWGPEMVPATG